MWIIYLYLGRTSPFCLYSTLPEMGPKFGGLPFSIADSTILGGGGMITDLLTLRGGFGQSKGQTRVFESFGCCD